MPLTKQAMAERIRDQLCFPNNHAVDLTEILLELIKSSLESGKDVLFSGFGKFCMKDKAERKGRNPATGKDAVLPARRVVTFKCSGILCEKVNKQINRHKSPLDDAPHFLSEPRHMQTSSSPGWSLGTFRPYATASLKSMRTLMSLPLPTSVLAFG